MLSRMAFIYKKMIYLTSQAFNSFFFSSPLNISFGQRKFVPQRIKQARKTLFNSIAVGIKIFFQLSQEIELKSFQTKHRRVLKPGVSCGKSTGGQWDLGALVNVTGASVFVNWYLWKLGFYLRRDGKTVTLLFLMIMF